MRLLLIEDSVRLQQSLGAALRHSGYALDLAGDGEEGLFQAQSSDYDAIILDIMLPKLDGLEVLRRLREGGRLTPVLLLTAKDTVSDRVQGLNQGADDYLIKPFALEELLARVKVLCRRKYRMTDARITIDDLVVDTVAKRVTRGGRPVELTSREFALLEYLASRRGAVVSRSDIEEHIYDGMVDPMSNVVDSAICIVRRKLAESNPRPLIHTRRGQGYVLEADETCAPSDAS
ncbi:MAG TPA: response regulator transcription factor [Opitutaceae bacterium]|nr:response regulator transcription factor [Opitutaceae bacterium]